ncbi:MAG: spermidine synthase [Fimbriimonadaceae bacterium]|jgi:spermidine synthase|nr:spermidine synthase [Fimbriimonadaceae bacterium]
MTHLTVPIRGNKLAMLVAVTDRVHRRKTKFQEIDIVDTEVFGRMLLLDGHVQFSTMDEHAYHESLVQIPMLSLNDPKRALVIGGGDGGVIRELCRHPGLSTIDMVEIDQGVIDACREHLPSLSGGSFEDPRVNVFVRDAFEFVRQSKTPYDLIVMDSTDVYEEEDGGLSERLFSHSFYQDCANALTESGLVITQADNLIFCPYSIEAIQNDFRKVFSRVGPYQAIVPSFGGFSGFCWGSKGAQVSRAFDKSKAIELGLRYLNQTTYGLAFEPFSFAQESVAAAFAG